MLTQEIYSKISLLPEPLQREALDFIEFLILRYQEHLTATKSQELPHEAAEPLDEAFIQVLRDRRDALLSGKSEAIPSEIVKSKLVQKYGLRS